MTERRSDSVDAAIHLSGVGKRYGATEALSSLSLDVARGEMFGLIGPDGAGKTTAIRLICGLLHADAGEIRVLGRDPVASIDTSPSASATCRSDSVSMAI